MTGAATSDAATSDAATSDAATGDAAPGDAATGNLLREVDEQARVNATLEVERRAVFTTVVVVIIAALFTVAAELASVAQNVFELAVAVVGITQAPLEPHTSGA